jgi:hypothetical protein
VCIKCLPSNYLPLCIVHCITDKWCPWLYCCCRMMSPIRRAVTTKLKTPESPPYHGSLIKIFWITKWRSGFWARYTGINPCQWQGFYCQINRAVQILVLYALRFQIPVVQLSRWHHHYRKADSHRSSTNYPSLTIHHSPRRCPYTSLVETRMFHNRRPAHIRAFPHTSRWILW